MFTTLRKKETILIGIPSSAQFQRIPLVQVPVLPDSSDGPGCHISRFCSDSRSDKLSAMMTAAMITRDEVLQQGLREVLHQRETLVHWDTTAQQYYFAATWWSNGHNIWETIESYVHSLRRKQKLKNFGADAEIREIVTDMAMSKISGTENAAPKVPSLV